MGGCYNSGMKCDHRIAVWTLASALMGFGAHAVTPPAAPTQPYSSIVDRNVFNLHPPPPPVDPSELAKNKTQIPKLTLNGFTTILGKKQVILTMPATKPGGPPVVLMLAEGQAEEEVEAKQIDEKAGVAKVNNHGEEQTLDFEHDGTKPSGPAGNPATPAFTMPPVPAAPPANTIPIPQPGMNVIRPLRTLPSRTRPLSDNGSSIGAENNGPPLTPEQTTLIIEAQRMKALQDGDPISKILPPTDMTPQVTGEEAPQ